MPKGRLYPLTRDELVECTALLAAIRAGQPRRDPAARASRSTSSPSRSSPRSARASGSTDELYALVRRAAPYRELTREHVRRGARARRRTACRPAAAPRAATSYHDAVNGEVRGRKGARLAALTSGGAIPEIGDYRVVAEPDDTFIGTVNEDWAVESMAGDIFLLGTHSWQIRRVEAGVVRVRDAGTAPPTVPFWRGEAPGPHRGALAKRCRSCATRVDAFLGAGDPDGARALVGRDARASTPTRRR